MKPNYLPLKGGDNSFTAFFKDDKIGKEETLASKLDNATKVELSLGQGFQEDDLLSGFHQRATVAQDYEVGGFKPAISTVQTTGNIT